MKGEKEIQFYVLVQGCTWHGLSRAGASATGKSNLSFLARSSTWVVVTSHKDSGSETSCASFGNIVYLNSLLIVVIFPLQIDQRMLYFFTALLGISHQFIQEFQLPGIAFVICISHDFYLFWHQYLHCSQAVCLWLLCFLGKQHGVGLHPHLNLQCRINTLNQ